MTPHFKAWKDDAEEFGFSPETQKGLIFLVALDLSANPDLENIEVHKEKMFLLSDHVRDPNTSVGGEFYDGPIMDILFELAELCQLDIAPKTILKDSKGQAITIAGTPSAVLPQFRIETASHADLDRLKTALVEEIGKKIDEDLEGAYVAGHKFFASYYSLDAETIVKMCRVPFAMSVPKFTWFRHLLNTPSEKLVPGYPIQKVLTCLLGNSCLEGANVVCAVADALHYEADAWRKDVWVMKKSDYLDEVVRYTFDQLDLKNKQLPELFHTARDQFIEFAGFPKEHGAEVNECKKLVQTKLMNDFGYGLDESGHEKIFADEVMLRSIIIYLSAGYALCR